MTLDRDKSVYAGWRRDAADPDGTGVSVRLDTGAHEKYLTGYPDGAFRPESPMTRAEAAQMFYNLLLDKPAAAGAGFADVEPAAWYAEAVNALAALGIIRGESEHRFAPEQSVTRAEFTAMAMRFAKPEAIGENRFRDIAEADWYYADVAGAVRYGWISGYPNGSFRPGSTITRAEAAAVVNRMLARSGDEHYIRTHAESLARFADLPADHWAYFEIMEAANGHEYDRLDGRESWKQT